MSELTTTIAEAIESAIAERLRARNIGTNTMIRCWHRLNDDYRWRPDTDVTLPCIDIRASGQQADTAHTTFFTLVQILAISHADDDRDHAQINAMEAAIEDMASTLLAEIQTWQDGSEWAQFVADVAASYPAASVAGITFRDAILPMQVEVENQAGVVLAIHYTRQ